MGQKSRRRSQSVGSSGGKDARRCDTENAESGESSAGSGQRTWTKVVEAVAFGRMNVDNVGPPLTKEGVGVADTGKAHQRHLYKFLSRCLQCHVHQHGQRHHSQQMQQQQRQRKKASVSRNTPTSIFPVSPFSRAPRTAPMLNGALSHREQVHAMPCPPLCYPNTYLHARKLPAQIC